MLIKNQMVEIRWNGRNRKWYEERGYVYTKVRDVFICKLEDVYPKSTSAKVYVTCDGEKCANKDPYLISIYDYYNRVHEDGKNYCLSCGREKYVFKNTRETILKKSISLGEYLILNYGEDAIEKYWSDKNILSPYEIPFKSGATRVWIKCPNKDYHEDNYMSASQISSATKIPCKQCYINNRKNIHIRDSIGYIDERFLYLWGNKNTTSPFEYTKCSKEKIWIQCVNDQEHEESFRQPISIINSNFLCAKCNKSKLESFVHDWLYENKINFMPQKSFEGLPNKQMAYDFYIVDKNILIECQGGQHYFFVEHFHRDNDGFEKQLKRDKIKFEYAKNNNIELLYVPYFYSDEEIDLFLREKLLI